MRTLSFKVPRDIDALLERLARQRGISRSAVIREALAAYAAPPKLSALDLAGDLVGAFKGGPPDLSSNSKYLEGFGESRSPGRRRHRRAP